MKTTDETRCIGKTKGSGGWTSYRYQCDKAGKPEPATRKEWNWSTCTIGEVPNGRNENKIDPATRDYFRDEAGKAVRFFTSFEGQMMVREGLESELTKEADQLVERLPVAISSISLADYLKQVQK